MRTRHAVPLALGAALAAAVACRGREDRKTPDEIRAEISALQQQRSVLQARLGELVAKDPRLAGMPKEPVRIGVPTALASELISKVAAGFVDQVTLELKNLKVKKSGTVKKVITIGSYELSVLISRVSGQLETGEPVVRFGGNRVSLKLPVRVASGTGRATIDFKWDGKNVSGAVCGDMDVHQEVTGSVKPADYPVEGALQLSATVDQILASPKFPPIKVNLKVKASEASWAEVQKLLDSQEGVCGFVVDKVDIRNILLGLLDRGFNVRLPTEKIKPIAVPVGIQPTIEIKGRTVHLALKLGHLQITEHMIWLGANVGVDIEDKKPPPVAAPGPAA